MINTDLRAPSSVFVSKIRYQLLVPEVTPTSTRVFFFFFFFFFFILMLTVIATVSKRKTNYIIKQLLTIEVSDMTLISTIEYQYWHRLLPPSILVFSGGYHVISNTAIVNNCILPGHTCSKPRSFRLRLEVNRIYIYMYQNLIFTFICIFFLNLMMHCAKQLHLWR